MTTLCQYGINCYNKIRNKFYANQRDFFYSSGLLVTTILYTYFKLTKTFELY